VKTAKTASKKTPGRGKPQRDLEVTRARILKAAAREFAQKGLEGARIDGIAERSRANKAMIYYIFGGKEALHLAVLENLFEEKTRHLDAEILADVPTVPDLFRMLSSYLDAFLGNPAATRMILHDLAAGATALKQLKKKRPDLIRPFQEISSRLKTLMDQEKIRAVDPDKAVLTAVLLLIAVPVFLPHADLLHPKGSPEYENISSTEQWKRFLAETLIRVLS